MTTRCRAVCLNRISMVLFMPKPWCIVTHLSATSNRGYYFIVYYTGRFRDRYCLTHGTEHIVVARKLVDWRNKWEDMRPARWKLWWVKCQLPCHEQIKRW